MEVAMAEREACVGLGGSPREGKGESNACATSSAKVGLTDLPDELISLIFCKLDYRSLARAEECCRRFRLNVRQGQIWRKLCLSQFCCLSGFLHSQYGILLSEQYDHKIELSSDHETNQSLLLKTLAANVNLALEEASDSFSPDSAALVGDPSQEKNLPSSLIARAVEATSTDLPEESIHNVLSLETRVLSSFFKLCYWSSKGSESPTASDAVVFQLSHPLAVVNAIQIRPFEAHFQAGSPIYSPLFVRFSFGAGKCETKDLAEIRDSNDSDGFPSPSQYHSGERRRRSDGSQSGGPRHQKEAERTSLGWNWVSKLYPMEQINALQTFVLPPTLCCGGYVRIELLGRTQKQEIDNMYYVCLSYVKVLGTPVRDFDITVDDTLEDCMNEGNVSEPTLVFGPSGL